VVDWVSPAITFPEEHAAIGALAAAVTYALAPGELGAAARSHAWVPRYAIAGFTVLVFLKELWWDPVNEVGQPFLWTGATDLSWYLVGIGAMLGALWVRYRRL
jgi:hypothetical protein